mmetsp:Transcript_10757/g.36507  ORF Transcript_10757/g.36507 Transcript_10757/m.36507 type:complete len:218 (+) Transcript_10757:129-782(+)
MHISHARLKSPQGFPTTEVGPVVVALGLAGGRSRWRDRRSRRNPLRPSLALLVQSAEPRGTREGRAERRRVAQRLCGRVRGDCGPRGCGLPAEGPARAHEARFCSVLGSARLRLFGHRQHHLFGLARLPVQALPRPLEGGGRSCCLVLAGVMLEVGRRRLTHDRRLRPCCGRLRLGLLDVVRGRCEIHLHVCLDDAHGLGPTRAETPPCAAQRVGMA